MSAGLLDTSVLVSGLTSDDLPRLPDELAISVMSVGELHAGVLTAADDTTRATRLRRLADVQREFAVLEIDIVVAQHFGELRARAGRPAVGDMLIAATAAAHGLLLVTRDQRQARLLDGSVLLD